MSVTGKQIAMARILLDLNQQNLADNLSIARKTIIRIENGQSPGSSPMLKKIRTYFENNGIRFTSREGVERNMGIISVLKGQEGFRDILNDLYEQAKNNEKGKFNICLYNARPSNWYKWVGEDWYKDVHLKRMKEIKHKIDFRITAKENDHLFIAQDFAEYRWFPEKLWNEKSFYCYGNKLAFVDFTEKDVQIMVLQHKKFSQGFRTLFDIAWDRVAIKPKKK